jgi:hypothetical protein
MGGAFLTPFGFAWYDTGILKKKRSVHVAAIPAKTHSPYTDATILSIALAMTATDHGLSQQVVLRYSICSGYLVLPLD